MLKEVVGGDGLGGFVNLNFQFAKRCHWCPTVSQNFQIKIVRWGPVIWQLFQFVKRGRWDPLSGKISSLLREVVGSPLYSTMFSLLREVIGARCKTTFSVC